MTLHIAEISFSLSSAPLAPLDSASLKLYWAQRHLDSLNSQLSSFYRSDNESSGGDHNADGTTELVHKPFVMPPLQLWSLIIGDAVHNLRSSLDHIVYALAVRNLCAKGESRIPDRRTGFPLLPKPNAGQFNDATGDIAQAARDVIQRFQPYDRRNCLWPLAELDIADKHHQLMLHEARVSLANIHLSGDTPVEIGVADGRVFSHDPVSGEKTEHLQPNKSLSITLEVQLPRSGGSIGLPAIHQIHDFIGREVIPAFPSFFA